MFLRNVRLSPNYTALQPGTPHRTQFVLKDFTNDSTIFGTKVLQTLDSTYLRANQLHLTVLLQRPPLGWT
jgi:hypothetical protein